MDNEDFWIVEHFDELITQYAGACVAVVNETLVPTGASGKEGETKAPEVESNTMTSVLRVRREERIWCWL